MVNDSSTKAYSTGFQNFFIQTIDSIGWEKAIKDPTRQFA
jgi:hypothetical protein